MTSPITRLEKLAVGAIAAYLVGSPFRSALTKVARATSAELSTTIWPVPTVGLATVRSSTPSTTDHSWPRSTSVICGVTQTSAASCSGLVRSTALR
jgi:hypothetical protein